MHLRSMADLQREDSAECKYIVNEAGGAASAGGDMYFQAGYAFKDFNLFAGAGRWLAYFRR